MNSQLFSKKLKKLQALINKWFEAYHADDRMPDVRWTSARHRPERQRRPWIPGFKVSIRKNPRNLRSGGLMRMTGLEPARLAAQEPKFHRYPSTDYQSAHFMGIPCPWLPLITTNYYPRWCQRWCQNHLLSPWCHTIYFLYIISIYQFHPVTL